MKGNNDFGPEETERESTPDEIWLAKELAVLRDAIANEKEIGDSESEESRWLHFLERGDIQRFIDDGFVTIWPLRAKKGEFEKAEIRDRQGNLLFYWNKKDSAESEKKRHGLDRLN